MESIKDINDNSIYKEGEALYPINEQIDDKLSKLYTLENWAEVFYHLKEGKLKQRFIEKTKKSEYSQFFEGLNYEYGINNYPQDLTKAFQIYKQAANNTNDALSMYRMYHIYKTDFLKFNIPKRSRIYEKFYIFKCYSFMRYPLIERDQNLFNRFDIVYEIDIHFDEDKDCKIFHKFINFLNKNYKIYDINPKDLIIIESVIDNALNYNKTDKEKSLKKLSEIANTDNLEALYKFTCLMKDKNNKKEEVEKMFKILIDKKYYRSYIDYALYLNKNKRYKEALDILLIAINNNIIPAGIIYFDIFLEETDFFELMNEAVNSSLSKECKLYLLLEILIDDIITESVYSYFEFIFFRKIIVKHYNLENEFSKHFFDYMKEIVIFLLRITEEKDNNKKFKNILKYFCREEYIQELHLACGTLYFYGIDKILPKDIRKALDYFVLSYRISDSKSYKRFCFFYIYKIRKLIHNESSLQQNNGSNNIINNSNLGDIEKAIFNKYYNSLNEENSLLSASYFYYLSRLFHKKIGNNGDILLEIICINRACEYRNTTPGSGSIINIYRKNKSKMLKNKYKEEYKEELSKINIHDSEGYGDDGSICPICFEFKRNKMALPCKHLFCEFCLEKVNKCPICRRKILIKYFVG